MPTDNRLSPEEIARYSRHLTLPQVALEGQERLRRASVVLVGVGGLGSPLAMYLAAAGVGQIGIVDDDRVDLSNLQRQVLYGSEDVGAPKVDVAERRIRSINPHVSVRTHPVRLDAGNALDILGDYDVVIDGTDNFPTRYLVNDACVLLNKPNVYGSIFRFEGQVSVFWAPHGPCYRCLFPEPPAPGSVPGCAEGGVLGVLPGTIGTLQATEALKLILDLGEPLIGRLLLFDALGSRMRELTLRRDPACPVCGDAPSIRELSPAAEVCAAVSPGLDPDAELDVGDLKLRMDRGEPLSLLDVRTHQEWAICRIPGAQHLPLQELDARFEDLARDESWVVYCHHGIRSAVAARMLRERGYRVWNLAGGIDAWSQRVDPGVPRY